MLDIVVNNIFAARRHVQCYLEVAFLHLHVGGFRVPEDLIVAYFRHGGDVVLLYNPYKNLTVKQICWKVLDMDGVPHPENLTAIILMTVSEIWG